MKQHQEDEEFVFIDFDKVNVGQHPCRIIAVMKIPGVYQIVFSNAASWFRGKDLAYRIVVLDPVSLEDEVVNPND